MKQRIAAVLLCLCGITAHAQQVAVTVVDRDLDIPLEGVRLEQRGTEPVFTDRDGTAVVSLGDETRVLLQALLPGYESRRVWITADQTEATIELSLEGVVLGEELVVEEESVTRDSDETGVSRTVDREAIDTSGRQGVVEDVMSSIKLLPGVGYAGGWDALPSVRGGHPLDMRANLDGFYVLTPYQWGGGFSIFTPQMTESATLSHGIFSARYGQAMSGLLEVHSRDALGDGVQWETSMATSAIDAFVQAPLGKTAGFYLGGKVTYLEGTFAAVGADEGFTEVPYIRNGYGRLQWDHTPRVRSSLTFFSGFDGVGSDNSIDPEDSDRTLGSESTLDWQSHNSLVLYNLQLLPRDNIAVRLTSGYNYYTSDVSISQRVYGKQEYSEDFQEDYAGLLGGSESVEIDLTLMDGTTYTEYQTAQLRGEADIEWGEGHVFTLGGEAAGEQHANSEDVQMTVDTPTDTPTENGFELTSIRSDLENEDNRILNSGGFVENGFAFAGNRGDLQIGLRLDHSYIEGDGYTLNTRPVVNPRVNLRYRLAGDSERNLHAVLGSGLFSKIPQHAAFMQEGFSGDDLGPERNLTSLAGLEWNPYADWKISLETYHKYLFNRMYYHLANQGETATAEISSDGIGHVLGTDVLIHRHQGRYWDGYLSYTWNWTRLLNPDNDSGDTVWYPSGAPAGDWYYPNYHRFHNLNLILGYRPTPGLSINSRFSFASGGPRTEPGDIESYPAVIPGEDGEPDTIVERYARKDSYSDSLRNGFSIPLDLRMSFSNYYTDSRVQWEYYFAVENLLTLVYNPTGNTRFDAFSGEDIAGSDQADFSIGMPIPSFGFKLSY